MRVRMRFCMAVWERKRLGEMEKKEKWLHQVKMQPAQCCCIAACFNSTRLSNASYINDS